MIEQFSKEFIHKDNIMLGVVVKNRNGVKTINLNERGKRYFGIDKETIEVKRTGHRYIKFRPLH